MAQQQLLLLRYKMRMKVEFTVVAREISLVPRKKTVHGKISLAAPKAGDPIYCRSVKTRRRELVKFDIAYLLSKFLL